MNNNIFEIPEIASQIASRLPPADLFIASCVCRTWFIPFANELWRTIKPDQWTHGALLDALPRYSLFIRELHCSLYIPLNKLGLDCTKLTLFKAPMLDLSNTETIMSILRRNLDIEELWLRSSIPWEHVDLTMECVRIISSLKKLKRLSLNEFKVIPGANEHLLKQLLQLEELSIEGCEARQISGLSMIKNIDLSTESPLNQDKSTELLEHAEPSQLRRLHMDGFQDSFESILMIARNAPLLETLSLSETSKHSIDLSFSPDMSRFCQELSEQCPRLDQLVLKESNIDIEGLVCLLSAFPKLKRFAVEDLGLENFQLLRIFLDQPGYCDTLEEIHINTVQGNHSRQPTSDAVLGMLRGFPRLRKAVLKQCSIDAERIASSDGINMAKGVMHDDHHAFRCLDLEVLETIIVGPNKRWAPPSVFTWEGNFHSSDDEDEEGETSQQQPQRTYRLYDSVVRQLNTLPNLDMSKVYFSYKF
ncbi:hypothetical protein BGX27_000749 [Mortierella sp. AM989]|nr:hypothetical protein BGX27_000749 [Mortierella sp. AM989]